MAKKNVTALAAVEETNSLAVRSKINFSADDVVSVQSAKIERKLRVARKGAREALDTLREEERELSSNLSKALVNLASKDCKPGMKKYESALKEIVGNSLSFKSDVRFASYCPERKHVEYTVDVTARQIDWAHNASFDRKVDSTTAIDKMHVELAKKSADIREARVVLDKIEKSLQNMNTIERQLKASAAEASISRTDEGKALIEAMESASEDVSAILDYTDLL